MLISVICWMAMGFFAGWLTSKIANGGGDPAMRDIVLGIVGAVVGGWLFYAAGSVRVTGFNVGSLWSLLFAVIGAIVLLVVWYTLRGRKSHP